MVEIFKFRQYLSEEDQEFCVDEGNEKYDEQICWIVFLTIPITQNEDGNNIPDPSITDLNYETIIEEKIINCQDRQCWPADKIYCDLYSTESEPDLHCTKYPDIDCGIGISA